MYQTNYQDTVLQRKRMKYERQRGRMSTCPGSSFQRCSLNKQQFIKTKSKNMYSTSKLKKQIYNTNKQRNELQFGQICDSCDTKSGFNMKKMRRFLFWKKNVTFKNCDLRTWRHRLVSNSSCSANREHFMMLNEAEVHNFAQFEISWQTFTFYSRKLEYELFDRKVLEFYVVKVNILRQKLGTLSQNDFSGLMSFTATCRHNI